MRVLDGREQVTLSRLLFEIEEGGCGEVRAGDSDVRRRDWERVVKDKSG